MSGERCWEFKEVEDVQSLAPGVLKRFERLRNARGLSAKQAAALLRISLGSYYAALRGHPVGGKIHWAFENFGGR